MNKLQKLTLLAIGGPLAILILLSLMLYLTIDIPPLFLMVASFGSVGALVGIISCVSRAWEFGLNVYFKAKSEKLVLWFKTDDSGGSNE